MRSGRWHRRGGVRDRMETMREAGRRPGVSVPAPRSRSSGCGAHSLVAGVAEEGARDAGSFRSGQLRLKPAQSVILNWLPLRFTSAAP
jgi:hypothetical protein